MSREMKDSGVEWIGEIPEDWEVKQLRTYFSRRINKNIHLQEKNLLSLSYGRIVRKNIDTKEGLLPESFDGYNIIENGDIVIRGTDLQNDHRSLRTGLATERGIITSAYMTLRPQKDVNSTYYHYLLHCYDISKVFYSMGGGLRQSLDYWEFIRMPVLHPTDREQEEIVSYIKTKCTAIDTAIEKTKKSIEKLEEYKKAVITKAVTKGIDPNAKMKDSGVEWIGEIPENWDVIKLKYLLKDSMKYGATETGIEYSEELPRYIRITDITPDNKLKDSGKLSLTEQQAEKYLLKEDTILFARSGATVGKTFLYKTEYGRAAFAGYMISAIPNNDKLLATWLYYYTLSFSYEDWVNRSFLQATIQNIGADKYSNLLISLPCINKQSEIVKYLDGKCAMFDAAIKKKKKAIEKWEEYKKSLIYYAVTGKIDCRNEVI